MIIAKNFKFLRKYFKDKQTTLAKMFSVSQSDISAYENGKKEIPMDILKKIAIRYDVSIEDLMNIDLTLLYDAPQTIELKDAMDFSENLFPLLTSNIAKNSNYFNCAYNIMLSSLQINSLDEFHNNIFSLEYAITLFQKAWNESKTYVALVNSISIILLIYSFYNQIGITIGEQLLKKGSINSFDIRNSFIRDPNKPTRENKYKDKKIEFFEKYDEFVYESIKLLKSNAKFSDLGDYFLAICNLFGFAEDVFEIETYYKAGICMLFQLSKLDNKYADKVLDSFPLIS